MQHLAWEPWSGFVGKYVLLGDAAYTAGMLFAARELSIAELEVFGTSIPDV